MSSDGSSQTATREYGPYYRVETPSQTVADANRQVASKEVWGRARQGSNIASVKAYRGPLPVNRRGVEFVTHVKPHPNAHPTDVHWYEFTPGVQPAARAGFVKIAVRVLKNTQV